MVWKSGTITHKNIFPYSPGGGLRVLTVQLQVNQENQVQGLNFTLFFGVCGEGAILYAATNSFDKILNYKQF